MASAQTILIVEPDSATRELYRRELSGTYHVVCLPDAVQALPLLHSEHISAIVVEPARSDSLGWDFVATLKQTPQTRGIPVIICSVLDERRRGMECGARDYLIKPVLPSHLMATIRKLLTPA